MAISILLLATNNKRTNLKESLYKLIIHLQAMKLLYHNAHHLASKVAFFADHDAFGEFYNKLDSDYDAAVERYIGNFGTDAINIYNITSAVAVKLQNFSSNKAIDNSMLFSDGLKYEMELITLVEFICKLPDCKESDKQLISEFGNQAQIRIYKIKQRIKR